MTGRLAGRHVVIVVEWLELGGAERQAIALARQLRDRHGARVTLVGFGMEGAAARLCERHGIPWQMFVFFPGRLHSWLKHLVVLARKFRRLRPDAIVPFTTRPNVACGLIWKWTGAKTFIWNERSVDLGFERQPAWMARWAVRQTPHFVGNSSACIESLTRRFALPDSKLQLVHNGVDIDPAKQCRDEWRAQLGLAADEFAVCMLGNLHVDKDHATLIRAWRQVVDRLAARGVACRLVLAGKLHHTAYELRSLTESLGLTDRVIFLGHTTDVAGLIDAVELGVLSSRSEGCPNGVLEFMALGRAVVATDNGGVREALGPDPRQPIVAGENPSALADAIVELALDPARRRELAELNRRRAEQEFGLDRMGDEMAELIAAGLGQP